MSHSPRHQFQVLTKNSRALTGQRLARVIAKAATAESAGWIKKDSGWYHQNLTESAVISIPVLKDADISDAQMSALKPHIVNLLQDAQDKILKDYKLAGASEVSDEEISVDACIKYLDQNVGGGRITAEYLSEWFKESYSLQAAEFVAHMLSLPVDKMDEWTADMVQVVEKKVNSLSALFAGFASSKYSPSIPQCRGMVKFGEFLSESADARMTQLAAKAAKILAEKEEELKPGALGF